MIPVNLIRQYIFCPRIVYFSLLTNIKPIYPKHVRLGEEYHNIQEKLSKNRKFKKLNIEYHDIVQNRYYEDQKYNICGKVDLALICDDEVIPLEFKSSNSKKLQKGHIMQTIGYGILLSKEYNKKFKKAFVVYNNNLKLFQIDIQIPLKIEFFEYIKKIEKIVKNETFPNSSANENQCMQCEYINYCDDRF
jgi:CRISPR-associated exonuclease Cas4